MHYGSSDAQHGNESTLTDWDPLPPNPTGLLVYQSRHISCFAPGTWASEGSRLSLHALLLHSAILAAYLPPQSSCSAPECLPTFCDFILSLRRNISFLQTMCFPVWKRNALTGLFQDNTYLKQRTNNQRETWFQVDNVKLENPGLGRDA